MNRNRHMARLLVLILLLSCLLPGKTAAYAAVKQFTYAEQKTGISVESLVLEPEEKVDLKFIGVKDYKNYRLKWTSTNEKVATVDSQGVITAKAKGTATIRLVVGNEEDYISKGVTVTVGTRETVLLGTSKDTANTPVTLPLGKTIDLNFYGVTGWSVKRYTCQWISTNPDIAVVDPSGIVTPIKEGITVIALSLIDNFSMKSLKVLPIAVTVVKAEQPSTTPQPTPIPTPLPTWPFPTTQPTGTPLAGNYKVTLNSSSSVVLEFPSAVSYGKNDIRLYKVFKNGSQNMEYEWSIKSVTPDASGTKLTVEADNAFSNGDICIVRVGANDQGTEFAVSFGAPNRITVTYECLGAEGVAYAQTSVDTPVTLSYHLYHDSLDVTKEYMNSGYIEYEMLSPVNSYETYLVGNELTFYAERSTAVIQATFHYGANYNTTLTSAPVSIVSQPIGSYSLKAVEEWTIIDDTKRQTSIDWSKPVHEVTAGTKDWKIVLLFSDKYGIRYSTDSRGVYEDQGIYSTEDTTKLFAANNCTLGFSSLNEDKLYVDEYSGMIDPYAAITRTVVAIKSYIYQANGGLYEARIGTLGVRVLKEAELASIDAETKAVTLASEALPGFGDRFCKAQVKINTFDQYGNPWDGDCYLDLRCTTSDIQNALGAKSGPAYLDGTTLYIDAEQISALTSRTSVSFIVTEPTLKKNTTVTVSLKAPTKKDGDILINGWEISAEDVSFMFSKEDAGKTTKYSSIELLKLSKSIGVGLYGDVTDVQLVADKKFTPTTGGIDDVFVLITGPDGKVVPIANTPDTLGAYWDKESHSIRLVVAAPDKNNSKMLETLASGKYTVKAMKISSIMNNGTPSYATKTTTFMVTDDRPNIQFRSVKAAKSATNVSSQIDTGSVISIIDELYTFTKDGVLWEDWNIDMIAGVDFTWRDRYVQIKGVDFLIPAGEGSDLSYKKTVKGGQSIRYGAEN